LKKERGKNKKNALSITDQNTTGGQTSYPSKEVPNPEIVPTSGPIVGRVLEKRKRPRKKKRNQ